MPLREAEEMQTTTDLLVQVQMLPCCIGAVKINGRKDRGVSVFSVSFRQEERRFRLRGSKSFRSGCSVFYCGAIGGMSVKVYC